MATQIEGVFDKDLENKIKESKVLVIGAGGIGCELLKNLVLSGFSNIEIVDLDTIDVSNLNRQFLFHKQHVGKSKANVAKESALKFNPDANIVAHHASIISTDFGVNYFKQFHLVLNALDNRAARAHVNRMCLASQVPLIESGTAGYEGQVELIKKGVTKCYECDPKQPARTYPGCTIRNTPSEPIHCIVWAKHLFNQLFGEEDPDQDVSPDSKDPEAVGSAGEAALASATSSSETTNGTSSSEERTSTRKWAQDSGFNSRKLFQKFFHDDIKYLIAMSDLWKKRKAPTPLDWDNLPSDVAGCSKSDPSKQLKDERVWSIAECARVFEESIASLKDKFQVAIEKDEHLVWDKDDKPAMDFVAACSNMRAHIFSIPQKSRFDVKSMAGNIIPAIATSNAIVAGLIVLHAINILEEKIDSCQTVYLRKNPNHRGQIVVPEKYLSQPNPKCFVCSSHPQRSIRLDVNKLKVADFEEKVLKKALNFSSMVDVTCGQSVVISSEEGETEENNEKTLSEAGIKDGAILTAEDYLQDYTLRIIIYHKDQVHDGPEYEIVEAESVDEKKEEKMDTNETPVEEKEDVESKKRKSVQEEEVPLKKIRKEDTAAPIVEEIETID